MTHRQANAPLPFDSRKVALEPISPELVLVDPELARVERGRLVERAWLDSLVDVAPAAPPAAEAVEPASEPDSRRRAWQDAIRRPLARVVLTVLMISFFAGGVLAGVRVGGQGSHASPPPTSLALQAATLGPGFPGPSATRASTPAARLAETKAAIERTILSLVLQAPSGKLPPELIDRTTGLARDNLQAICHRLKAPQSFLCVVRLQGTAPNEGLYVRYRLGRGRRGSLTWYPYLRTAPTSLR
jgi:hypothetical protein